MGQLEASVIKVWAGFRETIRSTNSGGRCTPRLMGQRRNLGTMRIGCEGHF